VLTWEGDSELIAEGLADMAKWRSKQTTVARIDGESAHSSRHAAALLTAGFVTGYRGLTFRG
jgi:hypothetical protein